MYQDTVCNTTRTSPKLWRKGETFEDGAVPKEIKEFSEVSRFDWNIYK